MSRFMTTLTNEGSPLDLTPVLVSNTELGAARVPARYVPLMPALPVIIEAAINGVTTKERNPNVPRTPEEVSADALACLEAGAAIIHNHIDLFGVSEEEAAERYLEGWRAVLVARPDALLYPTIHFGSSMNYEHLIPLGGERCPAYRPDRSGIGQSRWRWR